MTNQTQTTITATNGQQATAPADFAAKWDQAIIDSLVMQAHRCGEKDMLDPADVPRFTS